MQCEVLPWDCESAGLRRDRPVNECPAPTAHVLRLRSPRVVPPGPLWMRKVSLCPKITTTPPSLKPRKQPKLPRQQLQLRLPLLLKPKKKASALQTSASTAASSPP